MDYIFQNFFLIMTIVLSLVSFSNYHLMNRCILNVYKLNRKEYSRLLLSGFVHGDYQHLIFNMLTYYFFSYMWGDLYVTQLGGPWWLFGLFYLSAIFVVNLVIWKINYKNIYYSSLGASGGVSAIVFSSILLFPWERLYVFIIPMPAIIFAALYLGLSTYKSINKGNDNINHAAHLVGSLYGVAFSFIINPSVFDIFIYRLLHF